jgi:hypothetical protein
MCVIAGQGGPIVPLLTRVLRLAQLLRRLVLLRLGLGGQRFPTARPYLVKRVSRGATYHDERRKSQSSVVPALKRCIPQLKNALSDSSGVSMRRSTGSITPTKMRAHLCMFESFSVLWSVAFARQLYVKISCLHLEEAGRVRHSRFPRCGLRPDPLPGTCAPQFAFALRQKIAPTPSY